MLNLLFQLMAELFITRPPGLEPGTQSPHARQALAELDSRYFRMALPRKPDTELGKLNRPSQSGKTRTREAVQLSKAAQAIDSELQMNANTHTLHRLHDPASFAWLSSLTPKMEGTAAAKSVCFGMDAIFLHSDMLAHYPSHLVLAIPPLNVPPVEYGFACTSKGQRWFCFVVVRKNASKSAALIFEVSSYALMFPAHGLRETGQDALGNVAVGRDYPLTPLLPVLCPLDGWPIRYEVLQPDTGAYFCLSEGEPSLSAWQTPPASQLDQSAAMPTHALGQPQAQPQSAPIYFDIGSPALSAMRVNGNAALINLLGGLQ